MTKNELEKIVQTRLDEINSSLSAMDDSTSLGFITLFPGWAPDISLAVDDRLQYDGKLYRVIQAHTSQEGWEPPNVPALFTEIAKPGEVPVWKQPTGAQDAYNLDDLVYYPDENGSIWRSTVDANVWEPGVYGWELTE
jgi:hypothetical protein